MQALSKLVFFTMTLSATWTWAKSEPPLPTAKQPMAQDCSPLEDTTPEQLWIKADCYFDKNEYLKSSIYLRKITALAPNNVEAFILSSYVLWELANENVGEEKSEFLSKAEEELNRASVLNPKHWKVFLELGDFYYLRLKAPERAFRFYTLAREFYEGNKELKVSAAVPGQKAAIENRIARTNEELDRRGEAVSASCLALHWDPDNTEALGRLGRLSGSCKRKNFRAHITGKKQK